MRHKGLHAHRYKRKTDNHEEWRIARAWDLAQERGSLLDHLLDDRPVQGGRPPPANDRDRTVAATIIQWLGSPVGQNWLADLGYVKRGK